MDLAAFHHGDPEALSDAVQSAFEPVWFLARQGFTCLEDGVRIYIRAADDLDAAEADARAVLRAALTPAARQALRDEEDWTIHVLTHARRVLFARAIRAGRTVSLLNAEEVEQVPKEAEDLDRLIEADVRPARRAPTIAPDLEQRLSVGQALADALSQELGDPLTKLVGLRFVDGLTRDACAKAFDCGTAAIAAREARIRRRLRARLKSQGDPGLGQAKDAMLDAILSRRGGALVPPQVTRERIRQAVLTSTFRTEARPYPVRLAWGLSVAVLAMLAWTAMLLGWIPGPDDDLTLPPRVEARCRSGCQTGAAVTLSVRAPDFSRTIGIGLVDNQGEIAMLWTGPHGGSTRLPFGARARPVVAAQTTLPSEGIELSTATVVAVFSDRRLDAMTLRSAVALEHLPASVITATTALTGSP